jgi:PKD repeat protein
MELTLFGDPILKLHKDVATLTAEQTLSAEIILHLSDFTPDATAYTASYNVYERDNLSITIPVSNITVSGNDIILTLNTDIPAGYPYNINISAMSGISGTLTRQVSMLSNIRELSVITEEVWSADNNPYYIYKYLLIKNRLTIEPGVELRINDDVGIIVYGDGVLLAEGTSDSPIVLSGYDYNPSNEGTWEDILFYRDISSLENSLSHCIIMNASTGVRVDSTAVVNIDNCKILNSPQYGIYSYYGEQTIRNTIIGYEAISPSTHGIYLEGCDSVIDNLTYVGNNSADISFINSAITLRNSIVRGSGGNIISTGSNLSIDYTNIEGSYPGSGNINSDPLFTNTAAYDYSLQNSSPCIDAGFLYLTPDPDNTLPDMGALYYHHPIAFEAQFTQGDAPLSIQFTNQSGGSPDLIRWDFNNDGNWDDTGDIGLFDTTMSGSYDVLMRIEKGTWFDTLLKEDYIVISDNATLGVTNPSISASETEVLLQWSADPDADYYLIYYAIAPNTPFQYLGYSETNLFLTGSISEKSFYLIKKVTISE